MKKVMLAATGLVLFLAVKVYAYDDGDFQIWNTDVEEFKMNKVSKLALEEEFRWADNANEFYYHHYDVGYSYGLKKWLNIGGGYRRVYELKKGKFRAENEPYLTATLLWDLKGLTIEDRSRMEYRHFDYQSDSWRYRNKFTAKLPWKFTAMEIRPYVSDEIFISFDGATELSQNRFFAGLAMNLSKKLKAELYYMLQDSKGSDRWTDANVLGAKLKIMF